MRVNGRVGAERVLMVAAVLLGGCAARLPTYSRVEPAVAMGIMADRADRVHTLTAQGQVTLTRSGGESVVLDFAMAAKPPGFLRLRAWKFGQAAMDLTIRPDGTWAWIGQQENEDPERHAQMMRIFSDNLWRLTVVDGSFFRDPRWIINQHIGPHFTAFRPLDTGRSLRMEVDQNTLLVRRITVLSDQGVAAGSIALDDYQGDDVVPWAARLTARSVTGTMVLRVRETELNQELPAKAFTPPPHAEKLR